jgi:hypothetical protein
MKRPSFFTLFRATLTYISLFDVQSSDASHFETCSLAEDHFFEGDHLYRLFVGWVPKTYTEADLQPLFEQVGRRFACRALSTIPDVCIVLSPVPSKISSF